MAPIAGTRAALYVRVSTDKQASEGHSLDAQRDRLLSYARKHGLEVVEVITDGGESGSTLKRPGFQRILGMAEAGDIDVVLATKSDRLSRNLRDLLNLASDMSDLGLSIVTADGMFDTGTAFGKAMTSMQGVFSELERDLISDRTKETMAKAKEKGVRLGRPPVGYTVKDGLLVVDDPEKQALALRALALRDKGYTLQQVADTFNDEGIPASKGGAWHAMSVRRLVRGPQEAAKEKCD